MISFRVGATDAELLEKEFAPQFTADDIVNLGPRQIYLRLSIGGVGSKPFSARTMPPIELENPSHASAILATSRAIYGKEKKVAEEEIASWYQPYVDTSKSNQDYAKDRIEKDRAHDARKPLSTVGAASGSYSHNSNTGANKNFKSNPQSNGSNRSINGSNANSTNNASVSSSQVSTNSNTNTQVKTNNPNSSSNTGNNSVNSSTANSNSKTNNSVNVNNLNKTPTQSNKNNQSFNQKE
jgi:hypothetical protein